MSDVPFQICYAQNLLPDERVTCYEEKGHKGRHKATLDDGTVVEWD